MAKWLNGLQTQILSPWHNVRLDAFTLGFTKEYILAQLPKVIYVALGETDDFAHQGNYPEYLRGANRADKFIAQLWTLLQSTQSWQHHASPKAVKGYLNGLQQYQDGIPGADQIWLAAMGPDVKKSVGSQHTRSFTLDQVTATAVQLLGFDYQQFATDIGQPLPIVKQR